jgi:type III pantothenate kinase
MRESLHARAAQLPVDGGTWVDWADDTDDALASGCLGAALALLRDAREAARARLGTAPRVLLHGGGAAALQARLADAQVRASLVLDGLACWAKR